MKHTPGPWTLATSNSWRRFIGADGKTVCEPTTYGPKDPHPDLYFSNGGQDGPDARLIAAAPDLLAACKAAQEYISTVDHDDFALAERLRAAIARAEGGAA